MLSSGTKWQQLALDVNAMPATLYPEWKVIKKFNAIGDSVATAAGVERTRHIQVKPMQRHARVEPDTIIVGYSSEKIQCWLSNQLFIVTGY